MDRDTRLDQRAEIPFGDWLYAFEEHGISETEADQILLAYDDACQDAGINRDVAIAQACLETGWFKSARWTKQQNPCGLGITTATAVGIDYVLPEVGIRAHVSHLCCYAYSKDTCPNCRFLFWFDPRHTFHMNKPTVAALAAWAIDPDYVDKIINIANGVVG